MTHSSTDTEVLPTFEDPRVQIVYELLCGDKYPPNPEQHWEGWVSRKIVAALSDVAATEQEGMARLGASEVACYRWPEDTAEHRAMRAAFCDGAALEATRSPDAAATPTEPFHPDRAMPGCMMPDGGDCCAGYQALLADWRRLIGVAQAAPNRAERLRFELEKIAWMDEFLDADGAKTMMQIAREAVQADEEAVSLALEQNK